MSSRILFPTSRALTRPAAAAPLFARRSFQTSTSRLNATASPNPVVQKRPVGAFRGGIFGFLLGAVATGGAMYYYVLDEYRVSNELLTEDIYALQQAVQRIEGYVKVLEDKVQTFDKKKLK